MIIASQSITLRLENRATIKRNTKIAIGFDFWKGLSAFGFKLASTITEFIV